MTVAVLTCDATMSTPDVRSLRSPVFPVASRTTWHGSGTSAGVLATETRALSVGAVSFRDGDEPVHVLAEEHGSQGGWPDSGPRPTGSRDIEWLRTPLTTF